MEVGTLVPSWRGRTVADSMLAVGRLCSLAIMATIGVPGVRAQSVQPPAAGLFPSRNGPDHYDPSKCSTSAGGDYYYFAVGPHVLRQPTGNPVGLNGARSAQYSASLPRPPIPTDPWGCPGHPLQEVFYRIDGFADITHDHQTATLRDADRLWVGFTNGFPGITYNGGFPLCQTRGVRDTSIPGFQGCVIPDTCTYTGFFQATGYSSPDGKYLTLYCSSGLKCSRLPDKCDAGFQLYTDFAVHIGFESRTLPIEASPDAAEELVRRIHAAEIVGYQWRPSNPTEKGNQ